MAHQHDLRTQPGRKESLPGGIYGSEVCSESSTSIEGSSAANQRNKS